MQAVDQNRQPFSVNSGSTGVLLIHGFTGSPGELRPLGERLAELGYAVSIPVLAGHCTSMEEMTQTRFKDWVASADMALRDLRQITNNVVVIGHSMGGIIALQMAAREPLVGVVSQCAPIYLSNRMAWLSPILGVFTSVWGKPDVLDPELALHMGGYNAGTPVRALSSLQRLMWRTRRQLSRVTMPALIQQALRDETVRPQSARFIYDHVGSLQKDIKWYNQSGHMLPIDRDREQVWEDVIAFIRGVEGRETDG